MVYKKNRQRFLRRLAVFSYATIFCNCNIQKYPVVHKKSIYYKNNINKMKDFFGLCVIIFVQHVDIIRKCFYFLMDFACTIAYGIGIFGLL